MKSLKQTISELVECAEAHEPNVCLLGNVTAMELRLVLKEKGAEMEAAKQDKPARRRVKTGERYWRVSLSCGRATPIVSLDLHDGLGEARRAGGDYFETKAKCQGVCDQINAIFRGECVTLGPRP